MKEEFPMTERLRTVVFSALLGLGAGVAMVHPAMAHPVHGPTGEWIAGFDKAALVGLAVALLLCMGVAAIGLTKRRKDRRAKDAINPMTG